jgi:hypothetical protein
MPAPIVRLEPRSASSVVWVSGRAVLEKERAGVRVAAAFEHQEGNSLSVRLEIENETEAPIEVSPDDVTFMTCPSPDNQTCAGSWGVVDPEQVLDGLDQHQSRAVADAANAEALDTSLVLLSAVGDVAAIGTGHANRSTGLGTAALAADGEADAARAKDDRSSVASQRELWSNVAFRRSTLAPGRGASGLVFLPIDLKAKYLWIHVRAGGQTFPFGFKQTVRKVEPFEDNHGRSIQTRAVL